MMRSRLLSGLAAVCLLAAAAQAQAGTLVWTGDTASGGTWHRPTVNTNPGAFLALAGGGQAYLSEGLTVDTTGNYTLSVAPTGAGTNGWGSGSTRSILAFLYQGSFNPSMPLVNQIENGSCGVACGTPNWTETLTAGLQYFVVVSGYCGTVTGGECPGANPQQSGPFRAELNGPGAISEIAAVPEPATWAMMLLGFGGLGASLRRLRAARGVATA